MGQNNADSYIQDGLIFQLDGIDKGGDGTTWVDRIGGVVFDNHGAVLAPNCVELDGSTYMQNLTAPTIGSWTNGATIEIAVIGDYSGAQDLFIQNVAGYPDIPLAAFRNAGIVFYYTAYNAGRHSPALRHVISLLSVSNSNSVADGEVVPFSTGKDWVRHDGSGTCIGCRAPGVNHFTGKVYAIRIYGRELTTAEMLFNQRIDNDRFNLGLTI